MALVLTPNNGDYAFVSMDLNLGSTTVTVLLRDMVLNADNSTTCSWRCRTASPSPI